MTSIVCIIGVVSKKRANLERSIGEHRKLHVLIVYRREYKMLRWARTSSPNFHIPFWKHSGMLDKKQKLQPVIHALLLVMHIRAIFSYSQSFQKCWPRFSICKFHHVTEVAVKYWPNRSQHASLLSPIHDIIEIPGAVLTRKWQKMIL